MIALERENRTTVTVAVGDTAPELRPVSVPPGLSRRDGFAAALLAAVVLIAGAFRMHPRSCGYFHDDGIYVLTAKALAEGEGYRLTNLPGSPPQTKYPIVYPALLAAIWKIWPSFPENLVALKAVSLVCGALFLAGFYLYAVRFGYASRQLAFSAGLLTATSSFFLFIGVATMSEMPFALLLLAALWWVDSARKRPGGSRRENFFGGVLLALPFLCRSLGLLFLPLGLLMLRQSGRRWTWAALGAAVTVAPWFAWTTGALFSWEKDPVAGYYTDYLGWWTSLGLPAFARVASFNLRWVATCVPTAAVQGTSPLMFGDSGATPVYWLFLGLGLASLGMVVADLFRGRTLATCLVAYLTLVIAWPWPPHRFLVPVLPFLILYLLRVVALPWRERLSGRKAAMIGGSLLAAAVLANGIHCWDNCRRKDSTDTPLPELGAQSHSWQATERALDWLKENTAADDVIAAGADTTVSLYTGRKSYYPIPCPPLTLFYSLESPPGLMETSLRAMERWKPRYLLLSPNVHGEEGLREWVTKLRQTHPALLVPRYRDAADPRFEIFEIVHSELTAEQAPR